MTTLADIQTEYKYALQDKGNILEDLAASANDVRDKAIQEAIRWYARRIPLVKTVLVSADSSAFYAVPADFENGSRIVTVEFPLNQNPPQYLTRNRGDMIRYQRRETGMFYFLDPNPSGDFRLTYTARHLDNATTIPAHHAPIVGKMAAAVAATEFVARYANTVSNNVDAVNYRTKEQEWRDVRKTFLAQVEEELRRDEWAQVQSIDSGTLQKGWK